VQSSWPGSRAPPAWLPDGRSTLDLFGRCFVLLVTCAGAAGAEALVAAAARRGIPLRVERATDPPSASATSGGSCSCARTAMSPGGATTPRPTRPPCSTARWGGRPGRRSSRTARCGVSAATRGSSYGPRWRRAPKRGTGSGRR
jgi:hypothetical protein